jgi:L-amino acid N-acyltransferase YncA
VKASETEPIEGRARQEWFEAHSRRGYPLLVAERTPGEIVGWASLSPWAPHAAYKRTAEVSIYVHQDARGRGVGRSLLSALIEEARKLDHHVLVARTVASNEASRRLHLRAGFSVGVMHEVGFKFGNFLDAELFQLILE